MYSIASGGLLGRGLGESNQKYGFVPEPENDMIFSIVVEELGLVGGYMILLLPGVQPEGDFSLDVFGGQIHQAHQTGGRAPHAPGLLDCPPRPG